MTQEIECTQELPCVSPEGPWLIEITAPGGTSTVRLEPGARLVLGSSSRCDVEVADRAVSQRHAELIWTPVGVDVQDLGSKNGIMVGSARVNQARLVADASHFQMGRSLVTLHGEDTGSKTPHSEPIDGLIGNSPGMRRLTAEIRRAAPLSAPVLVLGESGTGKDVVAGALHQLSGRSGRLVPLNMGALTEGLADAELFGHTRGAFTGASVDRVGAFALADQGTLFLDEVADLSAGSQVKLLRVVEDGRVRALGSSVDRRVDVRVVSATWANLSDRVRQGRFREDLLHRISTLVLRLPPLRSRKSDIAGLSACLLGRYQHELGPVTLSDGALSALLQYDWPGNVRELGGALYRAALTAESRELTAADVIGARTMRNTRAKTVASPADAVRMLRRHEGNVSAAARAMCVPRSTFRAWLQRCADASAV